VAEQSRSTTSAFFDVEAATYDAAYDQATVAGYSLRTRNAAILAALGRGSGDVLDAGMGPGRLCERLARDGYRLSGMDSSPAMVALARARLPEASDRLVEGRLEEMPFHDSSFDAVIASGVVEYVDPPEAALREITRVLRPDGVAIVTLPNRASPYALWKRFLIYPCARELKRLRPGRRPPPISRPLPSQRCFMATLAGAGLKVESVSYTNYLVVPTPFDELLPVLTTGIADRLERGQPHARALATQVLFSVRRAA
jgi:ubiquinone/menaquinone biosynthesis C-methylase UbiE